MENNNIRAKRVTIIGIIILILLFLISLTFSNTWLAKSGIKHETSFLITICFIWIILLIQFFYASKIEKQPFLLWSEKKYTVLFKLKVIGIVILSLVGAMIIVGLVIKALNLNVESAKMTQLVEATKDNFPLLLITCLTAGITEELLFRGYLMPRLVHLLNSSKLAIVVSSLIFGLLHYSYGTTLQIVGPLVIGLIFASQYHKNRSMQIVIICHFLWDFFVLFVKIQ